MAGKLESIPKKLIAVLALLAVISPLGILIVWDYGDAWGEWGEVGNWVPQSFWNAPLADYDMSGWESQMASSAGYIISAIVGVVVIVVVVYAIGLLLAKREDKNSSK